MLTDLSSPGSNISIYVMAGVATAPHFMESIRAALEERLIAVGHKVTTGTLFPYGDWSRSLVRQLHEIRHDLMLSRQRTDRSIGGRRVLEAIGSPHDNGGLILIGHSGGGVAAVHAAHMQLLKQQAAPACRVVMIGSPRCKISEPLRHSVLYLYAGSHRFSRKFTDPVCRLGTWGGWTGVKNRLIRWDTGKFAPGAVKSLPIIGGHADYFRSHPPFVNEQGLSNLDITVQSVWSWLLDNLR